MDYLRPAAQGVSSSGSSGSGGSGGDGGAQGGDGIVGIKYDPAYAKNLAPSLDLVPDVPVADYSLGTGKIGTIFGTDGETDFRSESLARMMRLANEPAALGSDATSFRVDIPVQLPTAYNAAQNFSSNTSPSLFADPRAVGKGYTAEGLAYEDWDNGGRATAVPNRPDLHMQPLPSLQPLNGGSFARNEAGVLEDFGRGWTSGGSGWSVLEGPKSLSYTLGGMTRTGAGIVFDGLTGAGAFRQAGQDWDNGNYIRAVIHEMEGVGTAGLTAVTLGDYALTKASLAGVASSTGLRSSATDAVALRRSYLNDKFGRVGNIDVDINIAGNKSIIRQYASAEGLSASDANALMTGVDLTQPVSVVKLNQGKSLWQYQSPGAPQGKWYSFSPDTAPSELGIGSYGINRSTMTVEQKVATQYTTNQSVNVLKSTSKAIEDTWSISPYGSFLTKGGATQLFSPQKQFFSLPTR